MIVWRNLAQHRLRTALTAIAVALGVAMAVSPGVVSSGISSAWTEGESVMVWVTDMIGVVFSSIGGVICAAAGFLIFNAFAMAVTQQQREIGALRSLGMARRQVLSMVLAEALFTGALGTALGLLLGPFIGRLILATMGGMGVEIGRGRVEAGYVVLAVVLGLGVTLLSALPPARRAARLAPLAALLGRTRTETTRRGTLLPWLGLGLGIGQFAYLAIAPPGAWSGEHTPWEWIMIALTWLVWFTVIGCLLPTLVAGLTQAGGAPLRRWLGVPGRLAADNLAREPRRVRLMVLTFGISVAAVVATGGILSFNNDVLLGRLAARSLQHEAWYVYPFDRTSGVAQLSSFDSGSMGLDEAVIDDVYRLAEGRAHVGVSYMLVVPELGSPIPGFPSLVMDARDYQRQDNFTFVEGDWGSALALLESGCGLLVPPAVAARQDAGLGDTITLQGLDGPVDCVVAAVGTGGFVPMSVIGLAAAEDFIPPDRPPDALSLTPLEGADVEALVDDLRAMAERHGDNAFVSLPEDEIDAVFRTSDQLQGIFNGLMLLAVVAAALGLVNTTMMNVLERRRELGLLRAIGATRRQVAAVVIGEAALIGLAGSVLGTLIGIGMGMLYALSYGGIPFGLVDLPLWQGALETIPAAFQGGAISFLVAPLLAAIAAWPAVRLFLRGAVTDAVRPL